MQSLKNYLFPLLLIPFLNGCTDKEPLNPSFSDLDDILSPTQTSPAERTDRWFSDQNDIRTQVLRACYIHAKEKADSSENPLVLATFQQNVFALYEEFPDCAKARKGELIKIAEYQRQGVLVTKEQQQQLSYELAQPENQAMIEQKASELAQQLKKDKDNDLASSNNINQQLNTYLKQGGTVDQIMQINDQVQPNSGEKP